MHTTTERHLRGPILCLCALATLFLTVVPAGTYARELANVPLVVGLDHVPVAVGNLDSAADLFRSLGFALKLGRPHTNGIRNQHVKFPDGTEIELITAAEARDSMTAEYRQYLLNGDGPAFAGLYAPSIEQVVERFSAAHVEYSHDAGLLTFPQTNELHYLFIGSRNLTPTDRPENFAHQNTAESLIGIWLASENPSAERHMLELLGADISDMQVHVPDETRCPVARFPQGQVVLLPRSRQQIPGRRIVGATVRVRTLSALQLILRANGMKVPGVIQTRESRSIFLPPGLTHGLWLEFRELR
jgi:hypothetical protein